MNTFTASGMVRFGWETFKKRSAFFIGVYVVIFLISMIASRLGSYVSSDLTMGLGILALAGFFIDMVVGLLLKMGTYNFYLKAHDAPEQAKLTDLWAPEMFWQYLLASIIVGLIVIVGIILLIVPGIVWAITYIFTPYLVIDKKMRPMDALRESKRITAGHLWDLAGFFLLLALLNIAGFLALIIGLLVTIPVTALALVHAYRVLEHAASEVAPAAPAVTL